jgi:hypothetical protein
MVLTVFDTFCAGAPLRPFRRGSAGLNRNSS